MHNMFDFNISSSYIDGNTLNIFVSILLCGLRLITFEAF